MEREGLVVGVSFGRRSSGFSPVGSPENLSLNMAFAPQVLSKFHAVILAKVYSYVV